MVNQKYKNIDKSKILSFQDLEKLVTLVKRGEYLLVDSDSNRIAFRIDRVTVGDRRGLIARFDYKTGHFFQDDIIIIEDDNSFHVIDGNVYKLVENNPLNPKEVLNNKKL